METTSIPPTPPPVLPDLHDSSLAFRAKTDQQLRKAYWLFRLINIPVLSSIGPQMVEWGMKVGLPITGIVKNTLFEQFCGGQTLDETARYATFLYEYNVTSTLSYSVEGEKSEEGFERATEEMIRSIRHAADFSEVPFAACKPTGIGSIDLMAKVQAKQALTEAEQSAHQGFIQRMDEIAQAAVKGNTIVLIDAEETWVQDVIDEVTEDLMAKYNQSQAFVYTTVQMYRHDRLEYLRGLIERAKEKGYILGVKVVRGAYMEKERDRAKEKGYADPIQPNKAATDRDYDAAIQLCLDNIEHVILYAATHNEQSSFKLAKMMKEACLPNNHPHVWFAQLLGMSDNISFNLAASGYNVSKYVPYGPVKAVVPYLIRRAQENTSVAGQSNRELELLKEEMQKRRN